MKRRRVNLETACYYCHGSGYVMRCDDQSLIKCIPCDGSGKAEDWRAWVAQVNGRVDG